MGRSWWRRQRINARISKLEDVNDGSQWLEEGHPEDQGLDDDLICFLVRSLLFKSLWYELILIHKKLHLKLIARRKYKSENHADFAHFKDLQTSVKLLITKPRKEYLTRCRDLIDMRQLQTLLVTHMNPHPTISLYHRVNRFLAWLASIILWLTM